MLSPLFKAFMLFAIPIAALARLPAEGHWTGGAVNDWVSSGNYLIYSCGSQAATVKNLLDLSYLYLQTAILSTNTPIYKAWFKSADPAFVKTVLTSMALGTNLTNSAQVSSRMTLICVNGRDPSLEAMWNVCSDPRVLTASQIDPPVTFVCPRFFEMPTAPVNDDCLSVDTSPRRDGLNNNQYKVLVGNLAELYLHEALGLSTSQKLRHIVGEWPCLRLSPFNALRNPGSYAYFAACECWLSFLDLFYPLILSFKWENADASARQPFEQVVPIFQRSCRLSIIESSRS